MWDIGISIDEHVSLYGVTRGRAAGYWAVWAFLEHLKGVKDGEVWWGVC